MEILKNNLIKNPVGVIHDLPYDNERKFNRRESRSEPVNV